MVSVFKQNLDVNVMDRGQFRQQLSANADFSTDFHVVEGPYRVLACDGTAVYGSMDGSNFRKMADVPAKDVAWTNGVYAAVGDSGVSASYDGFEWRQTSTSAFDMIVGGDGCFAAVSAAGLYYSTDPANASSWTTLNGILPDEVGAFDSLAYGCGQIVAIASNRSSTIRTKLFNVFNVTDDGSVPVQSLSQWYGNSQSRALATGRMQSWAVDVIYMGSYVKLYVYDSSAPDQLYCICNKVLSALAGGSECKITEISCAAYLPGVGYCVVGDSNRGLDSYVYDERTDSVAVAYASMSQVYPSIADNFEDAFWSAPRGKMIVRTKLDFFLESSDGLSWTAVADERPFAEGMPVRYRTMDYGVPQAGTFGLPRSALARVSTLPKTTYCLAERPNGQHIELPVDDSVVFSYGDVDDNGYGLTDDFHVVDFDGWVYVHVSVGSVTNNHAVILQAYPNPQGGGSYSVEYQGSRSAERHAYLWLPVRKGYGVRLDYSQAQSMTVSQYRLYPNRAAIGVGLQS